MVIVNGKGEHVENIKQRHRGWLRMQLEVLRAANGDKIGLVKSDGSECWIFDENIIPSGTGWSPTDIL